jgi:hypothetical protein
MISNDTQEIHGRKLWWFGWNEKTMKVLLG